MRGCGPGHGACVPWRLDPAGAAPRRLRRLARRQQASNIVRAARRFGLAAKGFRKEPSTLHELPMPCIIHWNFNHFVVLEGIVGDRVYINDPAIGRGGSTWRNWILRSTGVVLAMERTEAFSRWAANRRACVCCCANCAARRRPSACCDRQLRAYWAQHCRCGISKIFVDDILIRHSTSWLGPAADRHGRDRGVARNPDSAAPVTAVEAANQLAVVMISRFLWHVMALTGRVLHPGAMPGILQAAWPQRADCPPALERHSRQRAQLDIDRVLRRRDGDLRRPARCDRRQHVTSERAGIAIHWRAPAGSQPQPRARTGQACCRDGEHRAYHRNPQGRADWRTRHSVNGPEFRQKP